MSDDFTLTPLGVPPAVRWILLTQGPALLPGCDMGVQDHRLFFFCSAFFLVADINKNIISQSFKTKKD